jgi:hypothetical protein
MNISRRASISAISMAIVLLCAFGFATPALFAQSGAAQGEVILFDNTNKAAVQNTPLSSTTFRIESAHIISYIMTYHYFNYGALPGSILLMREDGAIFGPWQATGKTGQAGVANAVWEVFPEEELKPGNYTIIDSDFRTWSRNAGSGNKGHAMVKGRPAGFLAPSSQQIPQPATQAQAYGSGVFGNLSGDWDFIGNGYAGIMTIASQNGASFSGKIYTERLVEGRFSGTTVTFSRVWDNSSLRQDFTGTITIDASGRATMSGTFSQNTGGSYQWSAVKKTIATTPSSAVPSVAGIWDFIGNGYVGTMEILTQSGVAFSGTIYAEKLVDGLISGSKVTFTRSWGNSSLWQDFTGTLAVDTSGKMTLSGTFTQNGAGSCQWTAVKRRP